MKTIKSFGMNLPIIADLGSGWYLAAHPNGICLANNQGITVLWDTGIPPDVRRIAIEEFERFAWPRIKAEFYPDSE